MVKLIIGMLVVWRVSHLLAEEAGPFRVLIRMRRKLADSELGILFDCMYCSGLWISIPVALLICGFTMDFFLYAPSIAAGAMFFQAHYEKLLRSR